MDGNSDFASGGWPGDGSPTNPYIIQNLEIDASGYEQAIVIGNTTAHFVIRECFVHDASEAGVRLFNVTNGLLENNTCTSDGWYGILAVNSNRNSAVNCTCQDNRYGIGLRSSSNNTLTDNSCISNEDGVFLYDSNDNAVKRSVCRSLAGDDVATKGSGVRLYSSNRNAIDNGTCSSNHGSGILVEASAGNSVENNTCDSNGQCGVLLSSSTGSLVKDNGCSSNLCGIRMEDSCSQNAVSRNTCWSNGPPGQGIALLSSSFNTVCNNSCQGNLGVPGLPHQLQAAHGIYLESSDHNLVRDNDCTFTEGSGMALEDSENNTVANNNCSMCAGPGGVNDFMAFGIRLHSSDFNILQGNNCSSNQNAGISLEEGSDNNRMSGNTCSWNIAEGITLDRSSENAIEGNNCSKNQVQSWSVQSYYGGIVLDYMSDGCLIANNSCFENTAYGINIVSGGVTGLDILNNTVSGNALGGILLAGDIAYSCQATLRDNRLTGNGIITYSNSHDIDATNLVNSKPVRYVKDQSGATVPGGAGQVIVVNSQSIVVADQDIGRADIPLIMAYSSHCEVRDNMLSYSRIYGLVLSQCDNITVRDNGIFYNEGFGAVLSSCEDCLVWNNTFVGNNGAGSSYDSGHA